MEVLEPEVTKLMNFMYFQVKGIETIFASRLVFLYYCFVCLILCAWILNHNSHYSSKKPPVVSHRRAESLMLILKTLGDLH